MHKLFQLSSQFFPEIRIFEKLDKKLVSKHFEVGLIFRPHFSKHTMLLPAVWKLLECSLPITRDFLFYLSVIGITNAV